ncbi:DUF3006 domain-containing protein [Shouchella patagoniensis]|uniref:DUF3006 domain-containing protein n=1 Tax=Shouchella patagoniensis TaxID=228576 RepID=UPI0009951254|nr:DUF3006 domain-containing protein [Shouchella patagoniensis]
MMALGIIDRFSDQKKAVVLVDELNKQFIIDQSDLPQGCQVGSRLNLELTDDQSEIRLIRMNRNQTDAKKQAIKDKMEKLQLKGRENGKLKRRDKR